MYALSTRKWTMYTTSVTHNVAAAVPPKLTPANVSLTTLKAATSDGDGLSGTAALNDGDAAAQAAHRNAIDVKA
jgi:hypothetical protein